MRPHSVTAHSAVPPAALYNFWRLCLAAACGAGAVMRGGSFLGCGVSFCLARGCLCLLIL